MSLFLPPKVGRELMEERRRREAVALESMRRQGWMKEFDAELDRIVPGMVIVPCPDPAPLDAAAMGFAPGRWNLVWPGYNGGPANVLPLEDDDGGYREPGSWVFDMLARADMWNERAMRDQRRIKREAEEAKARRLERERAERDQEVLERYAAVSRTQVSMNRSAPWSQNSAGRRGAKR